MKAGVARGRAGSILLIEDTPSLQVIYRTLLQGAGYQVRVAATAAQGLAEFAAQPSQVVVLDLGLPDRDGLELLQDILGLRADTRIIVITANATINKAVEAMRAGAHEFLVKPFDEGRFVSAVTQAVQPSVGRPMPSRPASKVEPDAARPFLGSRDGAGHRIR